MIIFGLMMMKEPLVADANRNETPAHAAHSKG